MEKMGLFSTIPKLIKAIQVEQVQEIYDPKSGQKFLAQIGDWKVIDERGNVFVINYFQFVERYYAADLIAFQMFTKKDEIYSLRGKLFNNMQEELKLIQKQKKPIGDQ